MSAAVVVDRCIRCRAASVGDAIVHAVWCRYAAPVRPFPEEPE